MAQFVTAKHGLGIGTVIESTGAQRTIQYFRGPTPKPFETVQTDEVQYIQLPRQTRAYVQLSDGPGWRVGAFP